MIFLSSAYISVCRFCCLIGIKEQKKETEAYATLLFPFISSMQNSKATSTTISYLPKTILNFMPNTPQGDWGGTAQKTTLSIEGRVEHALFMMLS